MRLINADKLENVDFSDCIDSMEIMNVIDEQATAYDVDKVVKQLNEASCIARPVGWSRKKEIIELKTAIEIVKAGGLDER